MKQALSMFIFLMSSSHLTWILTLILTVEASAKEIGPPWNEYLYDEMTLDTDPASAAGYLVTGLDVNIFEPARTLAGREKKLLRQLDIDSTLRLIAPKIPFEVEINLNTPESSYANSFLSQLRRQLRSLQDTTIVSILDLKPQEGDPIGLVVSLVVTASRRREYQERAFGELVRLAREAGYDDIVELLKDQIPELEEMGVDPTYVLLERISSLRLLKSVLDEMGSKEKPGDQEKEDKED